MGVSRRRSSSIRFFSMSDTPSEKSITATSHRSIASRERCTRISPKRVLSSKPGVSIISDAPTSGNSIALLIGSVVVPAISDTMATCCPTIALSSDDLPLLQSPKSATQKRSAWGVFPLSYFISESKISFAATYLLQSAACDFSYSLRGDKFHLLGYDFLGQRAGMLRGIIFHIFAQCHQGVW